MRGIPSWVGMMLALVLGTGAAMAYAPTLQKVSPTKAIIIVDLAKERAAGMAPGTQYDALEAYLAIIAIQGIVNRDSEQKVYLLNSPAGFDARGGWTSPPLDQWALDDGMLPVPHAQATLDATKRWPALSYLAHTYRRLLKGVVRIPHITWQSGSAVFDSQLAAAITAAGQTDGVIASPAVEAYLREEGLTLNPVADVTALTGPVDAYLWTRAHYFTPRTNRSAVALLTSASSATFNNSCDYYIATRTFCTSCDPYGYSYYFLNLLHAYPPATCIMTKGESGAEIDAVERVGHFMCIQTGANLSVHSGFPSDAAAFPTIPPPAPQPIDPNGVYVAFYMTDGDSAYQSNWAQWVLQRQSAQFGKAPLAWSITPTFVDLFPHLVARRGAQELASPATFEVVADMHDGGHPKTPAGEAAYGRMYREKLQVTHGIFTTINPFWAHYDPILRDLHATLVIHGYAGGTNGSSEPWFTMQDGRMLNTFPTGGTQNNCNPDEMYRALHYVVDHTPAGTPVFAIVIAGTCSANNLDAVPSPDANVRVQTVLARCQAEGPGRTYYPLLPRQLAATWRERHNLALGCAVSSSAGDARQVVDGLDQTAWAVPRGAQWIQADLGKVTTFDEVDVVWHTAPARGYQLSVSDDGKLWTALHAVGEANPVPATRGRYVRVACNGPAALAEVRVSTVDRTDLAGALGTYTTVLKRAVVGNDPGQYTQAAVDAFAEAIRNAKAVLDTPAVTQREVEGATEQTGTAYGAFWDAQHYRMPTLTTALQSAENLATLALPRIDNGPDAFPKDAVNTLQATLTAVRKECQIAPLPLSRGTALLAQVKDGERYLLTSCPTPTPPDSPGNWAYHKPVQCGGTSAGFAPAAISDGTLQSLWKSKEGQQANWCSIDLGEPRPVSTIRIYWGGTFAKQYSIDLSNDGATWQTVYATTEGGGDTETILLAPTLARYVRLNLQVWPWGDNYQLREIVITGG